MNTHEKTEDQRKKTSQNMFNSEITDKNSPINAIRRVVKNKKKKQPRPPGISGVIEEDVEGEDEADEEEEEVNGLPGDNEGHHESERVQAEMSSDDDPPAKVDMAKNDKSGKEKDAKKDKKDKKEKEKKDSKKGKEFEGYKPEDVEKGKKLMSNTQFKSNLERLRQKFKDQGKSGIEESRDFSQTQGPPKLVPPKGLVPEVKSLKESIVVEDVESYGKQSEVILGQKDSLSNDLRTSAYGTSTRGLKDMNKGKMITPDVKINLPGNFTEPKPVQVQSNASGIFEKKGITIKGAPSTANLEKNGYSKDVDQSKPEDSFSVKESTKDTYSQSRSDQEKYEEDWALKNQGEGKSKPRLPVSLKNPKAEQAPTNPPPMMLKKKQKVARDDSDNSWDADKNPFE